MFRYFRRNQKLYIVVGGVILMFVFLVGDPLMQMMGSGNQQGGPAPGAVAVRWDGGKLTNAELAKAIDKRRVLDAFIASVWTQGRYLAELENVQDIPTPVQPIGLLRDHPSAERGWPSAQIQTSTVINHILAQKARKLGMEISDEALESYLADLGSNLLGGDEMQAVLDSIGGRQLSAEFVLEALREAMLAHSMLRMYGVGTMTLAEMPINRWEGWRAVNDHLMLEVAALPAEQFVAEVPAPTDEQLRELYEQYKEQEPAPQFVEGVELPSPIPGFAIPRRVKLQYLRANFDTFVDRFKQEVTDEEVAKYYEENKEQFRAAFSLDSIEFPDFGRDPETETPQPESDSPEPESSETPAETPAGTPAEEPSSEEPAEQPAEETPSETPASEPEAPADEPADTPATESDEPEASALTRSTFKLVAFQDQEEPAEPETTAPEAAEPEAPAAPAENEPSATEQPEADTEENEQGAGEGTEGEAEEPATAAPAAETSKEEYQPLEEVADEIRRLLAQQRFQNHIDDVMATIFERLRGASRSYTEKLLAVEGTDQPLPEPPAALRDLSSLAKEFNLEYERTEDIDFFELAEMEVGRSQELQQYNAPVWQVLYQLRIDPYDPMLSESAGGGRFGDRYLLMKTSDSPRRVPSFDEVKDQVREAWIKIESSKLALKRAEEYATKAQEAGQTLKDFFLDNEGIEVANTNSFTRVTPGDAAMPGSMPTYKLSQPQGVENVGPAFMDKAFRLGDDQVGAAPNHDGSIAYVLRVADKVETDEVLRREFLATADSWPGRSVLHQGGMQQMNQFLMAQLRQELDVEFSQTNLPGENDDE